MKKIALFSVRDLRDIVEFARAFVARDWAIVATAEACAELRSAGIPAIPVADFVGIEGEFPFPPTLHPRVEAALTSGASESRIEIVYDIPYPLEEGIDIGGMTLLALAAKGGRVPVCSRSDMREVVSAMEEGGAIPEALRERLTAKALHLIAGRYLQLSGLGGAAEYDGMLGIEHSRLANGENPYQVPAALFSGSPAGNDALALHMFRLVSGESPCYTNVADLDCILSTLCALAGAFIKARGRVPYVTIAAKHGNPCGLAVSWDDPLTTIEEALWGNPLAIWGGEVITNYEIGEEHAEILIRSDGRKERYGSASWMLDVVAAPAFSGGAVARLGKRRRRKLLENAALGHPFQPRRRWTRREVRGGYLRQPPPDYILDLKGLDLIEGEFDDRAIDALLISWAVAYTSNHGGNEVAIARGRKLIGGGGGPSTVGAAGIAIRRARENGHDLRGSAFTADAFFPYVDAPTELIEAGCGYGLVPAGGKREEEVRALFRERGVAMGYIPWMYRGFCRH